MKQPDSTEGGARLRKRVMSDAAKAREDALKTKDTAQTRSAAYRLAFADDEFLLTDPMRGVRLQLELQKPDLIQNELNITNTIVIFGSARTPTPKDAAERLKQAEKAHQADPSDPGKEQDLKKAQRQVRQSHYYAEARELARIASSTCQRDGQCDLVVTTGGGPGIMEAANRGAHDVGARNIGHNIVLPHEQAPNPYISPELCFQFHYFAIRKMHFLMRARALVCFPGGFGTLDELFEALTLIQTGKVDRIPVVLVGRDYWKRAVDFQFLVEEGVISPEDLHLFETVDTATEAWKIICAHYEIPEQGSPVPVSGL